MLRDLFINHPEAVGESYWGHQRQALKCTGLLLLAALACLVHALVPGWYQTTASRTVARLNDRMRARNGLTRASDEREASSTNLQTR